MEQQEMIFRLQMMEQQMQQLQQQMEAVAKGIGELESLDAGLDEIPDSIGKEILAQIGKGIYVKAKIISDELTVNIGGNNFVPRKVPEAKKMIREQVKKLKDVEKELGENIETTNSEFMKMIQEYQGNQKSGEEKEL